MAIRVALHHKTDYQYDRMVELSPQVVRLRPAPHCRTPITAYSLKIEPRDHFINWQQDPQSNYLARIVFPKKVHHFSVEVDLIAEISVINPFDFFLEPYAEQWPFHYADDLRRELAPCLVAQPAGPKLRAYLKEMDLTAKRSQDLLVAMNQQLQRAIAYIIRPEPGIQSCEETLTLKRGSCRDTAWLMVEILRNIGLAARFVSGYLIQLKPDVKPLEGPEGPSQDFTDLHAWAEVYLPGAGWIGLDPTSGLFAGEGHIPLATAPEASSAAPVSGSVGPCKVEFHHEMSITRIHEDPRVTLPYTDEQWHRIESLGYQIDGDISAGDIRLTMGGEPTFVSIDDMEGAEWNIAALGTQKRKLSEALLWRLYAALRTRRPAPHRARKMVSRRASPAMGIELLLAQGRCADLARPGTFRARRRLLRIRSGRCTALLGNACDAARRRSRIRQRGVRGSSPLPPARTAIADQRRSHRQSPRRPWRARAHTARLRAWTGHSYRLRAAAAARQGKDGPQWQTGLWMLRGQHIFLVPGDSALGLRLPLSSLAWVAPSEAPQIFPVDPTGQLPPLPEPQHISPAEPKLQSRGVGDVRDKKPALGESAPWIVRTALCVEPRDGRLHVFMPPLSSTEDYIDLLAAIEDTAAHLGMPVVIEGYTPPPDYRINKISVTPDPGVIEVNIHPAHNWSELASLTTALYEDARQSRLGTEKFMLDGRHTGTGGGNHFAMGGATPADSPFLRRPDLLRSMLGYWLNHPALSYLFSGMFIGPTSQAPRIDEGRIDNLYELEIAFSQVPNPGRSVLPAVAGGSDLSPHPGGPDRQYASSGVLYRQTLFARHRDRPPRPARDAGLRDAAARADEPDATIVGTRFGRVVLARALPSRADRMGHTASRLLHAPIFRVVRLSRRARSICGARDIRSNTNGLRLISSFATRFMAA